MGRREFSNKIDVLIAKFENGKERYMTDAYFNQVVNALARGEDPLNIIDQLLKSNNEAMQRFQDFVNNDTGRIIIKP